MPIALFSALACALLLVPTPKPAAEPPVAPKPAEVEAQRGLKKVADSEPVGYRKKLAVVVGIDYTGTNLRLGNAEKDAERVHYVLTNCFGYKADEVKLLLGEKATKKAIEELLHNGFLCGEDVTAEDSVLFYFSGHGDFRPNANGVGGQGYLYPADVSRVDQKSGSAINTGTAIKLTETLVKNLQNNCKARHKLLILDCCHSGAVFRVEEGSTASGGTIGSGGDGLLAAPAFQAITASREWQTASDGKPGAGNSPFTANLVSAMCTLGKKKALGGGPFTMAKLFTAMQGFEANLPRNQQPECRFLDGNRGEFHFFPDPKGQFPSAELSDEEQKMLLTMVPSTFGNWWADEIPWFMPSLRQEFWDPQTPKRSSNNYTDIEDIRRAAQKLVKKSSDDYKYNHMKLLLGATEAETRTNAMRAVAAELEKQTADEATALAVDLHYLAVLYQKLQNTQKANDTYELATKKYQQHKSANNTALTPLYALCLLDHGILHLQRREFEAAAAKFKEAQMTVVAQNNTPPIPFLVFVKCRESDAYRRLGQFSMSDRLMEEARVLITNYDLRSDMPLSAAVWKHRAWAMMEECRFNEARNSFEQCKSIILGFKTDLDPGQKSDTDESQKSSKTARNFQIKIDLFEVEHGLAMIERFQAGDATTTIEKFRELNSRISDEMLDLARTQESLVNFSELKQLLAARYVNSLERQGDCYLFGRYPDYAEAADDYRRALRVVPNIPRERQFEVKVDLMYRQAVALCLAPLDTRDLGAAKKLCDEADKLTMKKRDEAEKYQYFGGIIPFSTMRTKNSTALAINVPYRTHLIQAIAHALANNTSEAQASTDGCVPVASDLMTALKASVTTDGRVSRTSDRDDMERMMFAYRLLILRRKEWKLDRFKVSECCSELVTHCRRTTRSSRAHDELDLKFLEYLRDYYDVAFTALAEVDTTRPIPVKELIEVAWSATRGGAYKKPTKVAPVVVLYYHKNCESGNPQFYLLVDVPAGPGQTPFSLCMPLKQGWNDLIVTRDSSSTNSQVALPDDVRQVLSRIKAEGAVIVRWYDPVVKLGMVPTTSTRNPELGTPITVQHRPLPLFPFDLKPIFGERIQLDPDLATEPKIGDQKLPK